MIKRILIIISIIVLYLIPKNIKYDKKTNPSLVNNSQVIVSQTPLISSRGIKIKNINAPEIIGVNGKENFYPDHSLPININNILLIGSAIFISSGIGLLEIDNMVARVRNLVNKINFNGSLVKFINRIL